MQLMTFSVNVAFLDSIGDMHTLNALRKRMMNVALDGFEAEVAFSSDVTIEHTDAPDYNSDAADADDQIENWQSAARVKLENSTVLVSADLLKRVGQIIDNTVNSEECLCAEMSSGKCLYCRASALQDEITPLFAEVAAA